MSLWNSIRGPASEEEPVEGISRRAPHPLPAVPRSPREEGDRGTMANIGKSITIKGNVIGDEDTVIEGRVEGHIELKNHHLTVGPNGDVKGEISAKQVTIVGRVTGNVTAAERVELCDSGRLEGDLVSPRLLVQEGAEVNGNVQMKGLPMGASQTPPKPAERPISQQKAG